MPRSYPLDPRSPCYVYDAALATLVWSRSAPAHARAALHALREVTAEHRGAVPFSIPLDRGGEGNRRSFSGTMAWVGYAACAYESMTADRHYRPFAFDLADALIARAHNASLGGLVPLDDTRRDVASTEHNIDCYFFLAALHKLGVDTFESFRRDLAHAIFVQLYDRRDGRFLRGLGDRSDSLDCSAWGAMLALDVYGARDAAYESCIDHVYRVFWNDEPPGFRPDARETTVWIEGSLGVLCALLLASNAGVRRDAARIGRLERAVDAQVRETPLGPALPYATTRTREFSDAPSVAATAWRQIARYLREEDAAFARAFWTG